MKDIQSAFPNMTPEQITSLLNSGIDIKTLMQQSQGQGGQSDIPTSLNSQGVKMSSQFKGPSTNIVQTDFSGTSNIYSPYLYYNKGSTEKFTDDKFTSLSNLYR